jgi:nucleotide sugar dehydrogenase
VNICVVGLGHIGLPVAVQCAGAGARVIGADIDPARVAAVNSGMVDTGDEPGLQQRLAAALGGGTLRATTEVTEAVRGSQSVIVLVRLVVDGAGSPDYTAIDAATAMVAAGLQAGALVVYETTLPVGDTRGRFAPALEAGSGLRAGTDFHLCFSPERVSTGSVFRDLAKYPKLVGGLTPACAEAGRAMYAGVLDAEVRTMSSLEAAEFAKVAETTYRDVNIALANEFARFADQSGLDLGEVVRGANSQPYSHIHSPGVGVGGHCIPVYPHFFIQRAADARLVATARAVNDEMPAYTADRLGQLLGDLSGRHVLVLGLAYRGNVAEASNSAAIPLVRALEARGALVRVNDVVLGEEVVSAHGLEWGSTDDGWAEALVLQAPHTAYLALRPGAAPGVRAVVDGRGVMDPEPWRQADVAFAGIGR